MFYYEAPRQTLLGSGQFPWWNPWHCGGIPSFINPQSPFLSLTFLLTLPFGVPFGLKISAAVHAFIGMAGGYALARLHRMDRIAAMLGGLLLMGSTVYTLHVAVGHTSWLALAYLPWTLWCYGRSCVDWRWAPFTGLCLAATALHGHPYLVFYAVLALIAWSILDSLSQRDWRPVLASCLGCVNCGLLLAFKLLPTAELLREYRFQLDDNSSSSLPLLWASLVRRDQTWQTTPLFEGQYWGWWEYGAYVGLLPLGLALIGLVTRRRDVWVAALVGCLFVWISAGREAGLWPIVKSLPLGSGMRVPSRAIMISIGCLGFVAAAGLSAVRGYLSRLGRVRLAQAVPLAIFWVTAVDLTLVSQSFLGKAFEVDEAVLRPPGAFEQVVGRQRYYNQTPYATAYPYLLENRGVLNAHERLGRRPQARRPLPKCVFDTTPVAEYPGEVYLMSGGQALLVEFSPNRLEVDYNAPGGGRLVVNQNYHSGWRVGAHWAINEDGLLAADVSPGKGRLSFHYRPRNLWPGCLISALAWLNLLLLGYRLRHNWPAPENGRALADGKIDRPSDKHTPE